MRWLDWYGDGSLYVLDIGLACCTLEFDAASSAAVAAALPSLDDRAQVAVVISGTVTDRLAPAVAAIVDGAATAGRPTADGDLVPGPVHHQVARTGTRTL